MTHNVDMVVDFQYGSTGKGLLAGYLAKIGYYDTAICAFAPNAGHRYVDASRGIDMVTQQLPTAICSPTVRTILIGPGALIDIDTLHDEIGRYDHLIGDKRIMIHPHAAIVTPEHVHVEKSGGMSNIGSTTKGVGAAMAERIARNPENNNTAKNYKHLLGGYLCTANEYRVALETAENVIIEGAQGFSLSMYHGFYPYTTSRDVTPWQIAADCGIPFKWTPYINICGTLRTFPIRVNNRTGTSGPCYADQKEISWEDIGVPAELTTVTKLPRRVFTFSDQQLREALWHCGSYWKTNLFLNFANYLPNEEIRELIRRIETPAVLGWNAPKVEWIGFGPDNADVMEREGFDEAINSAIDSEGGDI